MSIGAQARGSDSAKYRLSLKFDDWLMARLSLMANARIDLSTEFRSDNEYPIEIPDAAVANRDLLICACLPGSGRDDQQCSGLSLVSDSCDSRSPAFS